MDDGKNPLFYIYMHQPTKNSTYDGLCYTSHTSRGALAGTRNGSMDDGKKGIFVITHCTMSGHCTTELHPTPKYFTRTVVPAVLGFFKFYLP